MAVSALSFPVDIPWRRLCVSADMLDRRFCDRSFPYRWRSSVAVFGYEPPQDQQQYEDQTISYLKVVCTITGFQPDPEEIGLKDRRVDSYWNDPAVIENYREMVTRYYGCYGGILEVSLAPGSSQRAVSVSRFPYFVDFEPKKRDLYEVVTETGETMSRSLEDVNVRKGTTTSDSHEVIDHFGGVAANFSYGGTGGGITPQGTVGSTDVNQEERSNVRTTDSSRESRETYSHTTQLTQLYHQLNSYHLGTNRAVFFMLPRPHVVQSDVTFANGPRMIEGLQEFFFVVARPRDIEHVCVEAYLETAHIASEPQHVYEQSAASVPFHMELELADRDYAGNTGDDSYYRDVTDSTLYVPQAGWEIDLDRNGGYRIESVSGTNILESRVSEIDRVHAVILGSVRAQFIDRTWPTANEVIKGELDMTVTIYIRKTKPNVAGYTQNLWLTGRGVCCCDPDGDVDDSYGRESVTFETHLPTQIGVAVGGEGRMTAADANSMRGAIASSLRRSLNHPDRIPKGTAGFLDTAFLGRTIARLVRKADHADNGTAATIPGLDRWVADRIARSAPRMSRGRLLEMPLNELADRFGLSMNEVRDVRRASLGLAGDPPAEEARWDRPGAFGQAEVPDVVGLTLAEARMRVRAAGLAADEPGYADSALPRDTVLTQAPVGGSAVARRSVVRLSVSSGASVQIPDLIGRSLIDAVCDLRSSGLKRDPTIEYVGECDVATVIRVTPAPRSFVMPHERVILLLGESNRSSTA